MLQLIGSWTGEFQRCVRVWLNMRCPAIDFLSFQLRSSKVVRCLYPRGQICVTGGPVTSRNQPQPGSFFQGPREAEKIEPGNEVGVNIALET